MEDELRTALDEIEACMKEYREKATNPENILIDADYHKLLISKTYLLITLNDYM